MNLLRTVWLFMGVLALACASRYSGLPEMYPSRNSLKNGLKPTDWLPVHELESLPALSEITFEKLEHMSVREGADFLNKLYHLAQMSEELEPSFCPEIREMEAYLITPEKKKIDFKLIELPRIAKELEGFGDQEVTIFITGLPEKSETTRRATRTLVEAYMQRYYGEYPLPSEFIHEEEKEYTDTDSWSRKPLRPTGYIIVVDLGSSLPSFKAYATLDIEMAGVEIGNVLVQLTHMADVPKETIHLIGSNIAAHVAGAAARQYTRTTGHQLRRVTGLDPSRIYATDSRTLTGLARGDAEFVDVIHTSAYGMGSPTRYGDVDFYPNGPSDRVPGADNVVEASMRAVRYFAETVIPGNERNFPAVYATSYKEYRDRYGYGKRVYMGIETDYDIEGDFMLSVNSRSPFGRRTPTRKHEDYHRMHKPWKMSSEDY